jgi:hypothetical protein
LGPGTNCDSVGGSCSGPTGARPRPGVDVDRDRPLRADEAVVAAEGDRVWAYQNVGEVRAMAEQSYAMIPEPSPRAPRANTRGATLIAPAATGPADRKRPHWIPAGARSQPHGRASPPPPTKRVDGSSATCTCSGGPGRPLHAAGRRARESRTRPARGGDGDLLHRRRGAHQRRQTRPGQLRERHDRHRRRRHHRGDRRRRHRWRHHHRGFRLRGLADRLDALGGTLTVHSPHGGGTASAPAPRYCRTPDLALASVATAAMPTRTIVSIGATEAFDMDDTREPFTMHSVRSRS